MLNLQYLVTRVLGMYLKANVRIFDIARTITVLRNSLFSIHMQKDQDTGKSGQGEISSPHHCWFEATGREHVLSLQEQLLPACKASEALKFSLRYTLTSCDSPVTPPGYPGPAKGCLR